MLHSARQFQLHPYVANLQQSKPVEWIAMSIDKSSAAGDNLVNH